MSEDGSEHVYDAAWAASVAATRGVRLDAARAEEIAASVGPTLREFEAIVDALRVDDDEYEFRRLIAAEVPRDA
jgi:hypothetical protein